MSLSKKLKDQYNELLNILGNNNYESELQFYIPTMLKEFISTHHKVAIYCNGYHTQRLFADYVSELKTVKIIIDNFQKNFLKGYLIIPETEIQNNDIDGVIISSYKYRQEIKKSLENNFPDLNYLDIYENAEKMGILVNSEYYAFDPYEKYLKINLYYRELSNGLNTETLRKLLLELLSVKDLRLSQEISLLIYNNTKQKKDYEIFNRIKILSELFWDMVDDVNENNIIMFCMDGLRRIDFSENGGLKKVYQVIKKKGRIYSNAYSFSTSTYESLLPSYSECLDTGTESEISSEMCRFIKTALKQKRDIFFYTDSHKIICDEEINYTKCSQTITQKLWDFIIDTDGRNNGLFYIHELYESHFSFANPYTKDRLIARGTSMLFDYLPCNGGKLLKDYGKQLNDSLAYLDDTLKMFFEKIKCKIVFFADHGNVILEEGTTINDLDNQIFTACEDNIRIPLAIVSSDINPGIDNTIMSLLDINDIIISVMQKKAYNPQIRDYIKIGRNKIYNPDFFVVYKLAGKEKYLQAFTGTISKDGVKNLRFEDGTEEIYKVFGDK